MAMAMARRMKISKGGQLSVPAAIRARWQTNTVVVDDVACAGSSATGAHDEVITAIDAPWPMS